MNGNQFEAFAKQGREARDRLVAMLDQPEIRLHVAEGMKVGSQLCYVPNYDVWAIGDVVLPCAHKVDDRKGKACCNQYRYKSKTLTEMREHREAGSVLDEVRGYAQSIVDQVDEFMESDIPMSVEDVKDNIESDIRDLNDQREHWE